MCARSISGFTFAALLGLAALGTSSDASALEPGQIGCTYTADGFPVCTGTTDAGGAGGGGPSDFLGAFPLSGGGWMEVYSDDDGVWWVDHNTDGSVTIGEEKLGGGAQKKKGPSTPNVPGTYSKHTRMVGFGTPAATTKPNLIALKSAAAKPTGSFTTSTPSTASIILNGTPASRHVTLSMNGSGSCHALVLVTKDGKLVSSSGIVKMNFPGTAAVDLPNVLGTYKIDVKGNSGCMTAKASTQVVIKGVVVAMPIPGAGR